MTLGVSIRRDLERPSARRETRIERSPVSDLLTTTAPLGGVLQQCENAIVLTDSALRIWYANDAFAELSGRTSHRRRRTHRSSTRSRIGSRTATRSR